MSSPAKTRGLIAVSLFTIVAGVVAVVTLIAVGESARLWTDWVIHNSVTALTLGVVVWVTGRAQPRNLAVWVLGGVAVAAAVSVLAEATLGVGLRAEFGAQPPEDWVPAQLPLWLGVVAWVTAWSWIPVVVPLATILLLLFPDGSLPSPRWRPVIWLTVGVMTAMVTGMTLEAGPRSTVPLGAAEPSLLRSISYPLLLLAVGASILSLFVKAHRAEGRERRQIWVLGLGGGLFASIVAISLILEPTGDLFRITAIPGIIALMAAFAVALLRYRLYDIDKVVSRTFTYGLLSAVLVGVYAGLVFVPRNLLPFEGPFPVAVSTLAVAATFNPLRHRVQAIVDRRFNRSRYNAERTIESFSQRLRDEVDLEELESDLAALAVSTMQPVRLAMWLRDRAD